jgi:hypothetical protein
VNSQFDDAYPRGAVISLIGSDRMTDVTTSVLQERLVSPPQQATGAAWEGVDQARWFEEILATLVDIFYAHPLASEKIGFAGMADARGWPDVGIGAREEREPSPLGQTAPSHSE